MHNELHKADAITVMVIISAPLEKVWQQWTEPAHITKWAFASHDWEAPSAENDVRVGGTFKTVMAAKDKSARFDFTGQYTNVQEHAIIAYDMEDGRHVTVTFEQVPEGTKVTETFDPEQENAVELQRSGWQSMLENFKRYVERAA
jgi:uncharacterized protein YndB with AHSA1/START domain